MVCLFCGGSLFATISYFSIVLFYMDDDRLRSIWVRWEFFRGEKQTHLWSQHNNSTEFLFSIRSLLMLAMESD